MNICKDDNIHLLSIEPRYFDIIQELPYIHGDPFDRLIIATAKDNNLTILTDDSYIKKYLNVKHTW